MRRVLQHARLIGPQAGQERRPAGIAQRELAIGPVEPHAAAGQLVDARRLDRRIAVAAELVVEVVGDDEEDVELGLVLTRSSPRDNQRQPRSERERE